MFASPLPRCPACNGEGRQWEDKDEDSRMMLPCEACRGSGLANNGIKLGEQAEALKRDGLKKMDRSPSAALLNELMDAFLAHRRWKAVVVFTAEEVRAWLAKDKFAERAASLAIHPNSWGALLSRYAKRGEITNTGKYVSSTTPSSHGRKIPIWKIKRT